MMVQIEPHRTSDNQESFYCEWRRARSLAVLTYQPSLDGLRGVAVLAVMIYHSGMIRGGFLGVDMFFALSGFLITNLLLQERAATGAINYRHFFARRALRLLPALFLFVFVWIVFLLVTIPPEFWPLAGSYALAVLLYVANWAGIYGLPMGIFGHAWSLAIEEQFYFVWPVTVAVLARRVGRPRLIAYILATAALVSLAWRLNLTLLGASERRIYWATDAHADALLIGAALAFLLTDGRRALGVGRHASLAGVGAAVGLAILLLTAAHNPSYAYGASALAALSTAAIILATLRRPNSRLAHLLEARWLVGVGRISYGLYLWHFPIFAQFGTLKLPGDTAPAVQTLLAWSVTFGAALASYFLIERPALSYKAKFGWQRREPAAAPVNGAAVAPAVYTSGLSSLQR